MAAIHWLSSINGNFTNASDWSGGVVPGSSDTANLDAVGSVYTVTSGASVTVEGVELASNANLAITGGTFAALEGASNSGQITVTGTGTLSMGGTLDNMGSISLLFAPTYSPLLATSDLTLSGGGVITDNGEINTSSKAVRITNIDETIAGHGFLLSQSPSGSTFVNKAKGVVDCTGGGFFNIGYENPGTVVNSGTLEATDGILYISQCDLRGSGKRSGLIAAGADATVIVTEGSTVSGQRFSIAGGGTLNLSNSTVSYTSSLDNAGTLYFGLNVTLLGATTISGGGTVQLYGTIGGAAADDTLVNADNTLAGGGQLGGGQIEVVNEAAGVIDANGLTINCGDQMFVNAGLTQAAGRHAFLTIASAVDNTGTIANTVKKGGVTLEGQVTNGGVLSATRGLLTVDGAVSGSGSARVVNGTLDFLSTFSQSVTFSAGTGVLMLARSQSYGGTITGFSNDSSEIDLGDIGFVNTGEATFSGTSTGGVLTVSDGTHTASIHMNGDYLSSTFVASSDGHGGTDVFAEVSKTTTASAHAFVSAMAGLGAPVASHVAPNEAWSFREPLLTSPRNATA